MLVELVNKVLLPHLERRSIDTIPDLYLMEALLTFTPISLPAIMMEVILKLVTVKDDDTG